MILNYIGQELIWKLRGTHPYEKNFSSYSVSIRCNTPKQNEDVKEFFLSHLKPEQLKDVKIVSMEWAIGVRSTITDIVINNAFGKESYVHFINDANGFQYEGEVLNEKSNNNK